MIAILSDIHGNLEALDAVLIDARTIGASTIYCLGDIIGYGPVDYDIQTTIDKIRLRDDDDMQGDRLPTGR